MPGGRIAPTRHTLLKTNEELEAVRKGHDILERRRAALIFLMKDLLDRWKTGGAELEAQFERAEETLTGALETEGIVALSAAAMAREDHAELLLLTTELQGLPVPLFLSRGITKRLDERGYGILGTNATIDETATTHEALLELVVREAELETALRIVVSEIRRTNIRVNALEHVLIPELEERKAYIEFHLAEREREERLVQRFMKRKREAKRDREASEERRDDGSREEKRDDESR